MSPRNPREDNSSHRQMGEGSKQCEAHLPPPRFRRIGQVHRCQAYGQRVDGEQPVVSAILLFTGHDSNDEHRRLLLNGG